MADMVSWSSVQNPFKHVDKKIRPIDFVEDKTEIV